MNNQQPQTYRKIVRPRFVLKVLVVAALLAGLVLYNRQSIYDWQRLLNYKPPNDIARLASSDQLIPAARRVLYVNHPLVEDKKAFTRDCPNGGKEAAVLGCYIPVQHGVYVLRVSDARLSGIEQVTLAHELLHAEYDRLSPKDKQQVDGWLMDYYEHDLHDPAIADQMATYKKTEPDALVNEMHSVFGTEVAKLPSNLENYYKRYFKDRSVVTGYYSQYEAAFTSRQQQVKQDDSQLKALKAQIDQNEADLKNLQVELAARRQYLDQQRASGNLAAYNAAVPGYNALVDRYNGEAQTTRFLVRQYNALVAARNALVLEEQQLVEDISSQPGPIGSKN